MNPESWIQFARWQYDDPAWHCQVSLSNGIYTVSQEAYVLPDAFRLFGTELARFPITLDHQVVFEAGGQGREWAHWLLLKAYLYDRAGHAALLFQARNGHEDPWSSEARFAVRCEVAALNRLGAALQSWRPREGESLRESLPPAA
jgi:hypothetical protein